jgi:hypothetical protein
MAEVRGFGDEVQLISRQIYGGRDIKIYLSLYSVLAFVLRYFSSKPPRVQNWLTLEPLAALNDLQTPI